MATNPSFTPAASTTERVDSAGAAGAPTVTVEVAEHAQAGEGLSVQRTPTSVVAAVGATMTVALRPVNAAGTTTLRYSYSGGADATALTLTNTNVVLDRTVSLPGGVVVTSRSASVATWAYPNIHGDVTYTIDQTGVRTGPLLYDPYGQPTAGVANTSPGDMDNGWLGQHQGPSEHQPGLQPTIEMGARPYRGALSRFLRVDPIDGGATFSDYAYVPDPINGFDLSGESGGGGGGGCSMACAQSRSEQTRRAKCYGSKSAACTGHRVKPKKSGNGFTLGLSSGFCIFLCLEVGISSKGPYARPGIGFAIDSPSIVVDDANPKCGTEASFAYASVSLGPAQLTGGATSPGRSGDWESFGGPSIGLPDGGATPHYKAVSVGAGVKHEWTFC
ncbi:MAG: RHS repeat-associated core domain-containing protein [Ilumatobacteraceae bacterium]